MDKNIIREALEAYGEAMDMRAECAVIIARLDTQAKEEVETPYSAQWSDREAGYVVTGPTEDGTYAMSEGSANIYANQLNAAFKAGRSSSPSVSVEEIRKKVMSVYDWCNSTGMPMTRAYFEANIIDEFTKLLSSQPGPVITHMNMGPDASPETKQAVTDVIKAAYVYKPPSWTPKEGEMVVYSPDSGEERTGKLEEDGLGLGWKIVFENGDYVLTTKDHMRPLRSSQPPVSRPSGAVLEAGDAMREALRRALSITQPKRDSDSISFIVESMNAWDAARSSSQPVTQTT